MEKGYAELISNSDLLLIGIGNEWNWIKRGIREDDRYRELVDLCCQEDYKWLLPIVEFEYGYYNNDDRIDQAYRVLRDLIGDKKYFLISELFLQDALMNGFESDKCVFPCGNYQYLQSDDPKDPLIEVPKSDLFLETVDFIHGIITRQNGHFSGAEKFFKPFFNGKELYLNQKRPEYSKIIYNESAYLKNWEKYTKYLSDTLNRNLLVLELGVSLDYPTVIRWPFEKVTMISNKAHFVRVHERLCQHTPEIAAKTESVNMNSVDYILQESEGL
jgi:hypothetical protein